MTGEMLQVFLQKIREEPGEEMHRLVLADWLEEHEQPYRAELLRLFTEMSRLQPTDRRWAQLAQREEQLRNQHYDALLGPLHRLPGFWEITIAPGGWLDANVKAQHLERVITSGEWAWLESLRVHGKVFLPRIVQPLASPHLVSFAHLELYNNGLREAGARLLAGSRMLARLTSLCLHANEIGSEGVAALVASPHLSRLTHLASGRHSRQRWRVSVYVASRSRGTGPVPFRASGRTGSVPPTCSGTAQASTWSWPSRWMGR